MRVVQQLLRVVAIVVILAMGAAVAAVTVSQTAWFRNRLRGYVVAQANRYLDGELTIGQLSGNLFSGLELQQIAVATHGEPVITVDSIGLDYNLYQIATHGLSIDAVRLTRPVVHLSHDENGWAIARLIRKQETEADRQGPASPIRVDTIGISDATVTVDDRVEPVDPVVRIPKRIEHLDAKLSFAYEPVRFSFDIAHVSFRTASPYIGLNGLSGGIAVRDDTVFLKDIAVRTEETSLEIGGAIQNYLTASPTLNLRVSSDKTSLAELSALVPALAAVHVQPVYEVAVDGPLDGLKIEANVRSSAGQAIGQLTADVVSPERAIKGHVAIAHLDLDPIVSGAGSTDLTGDIQLDVQARSFADLNTVKGTVTVDAPRLAGAGYAAEQVHANARVAGRQLDVEARAGLYGTTTTARGRVIIPERDEPLRLDLRGQLRHLDLGRLPRGLGAPVVSTNVNAAYHVVGSQALGKSRGLRGTRVVLDATFDDTTVPGVTIAPGSQVTLDTRGSELAYRTDASVTDVDLERIGAAFHIPSLESETYRGRFNAHITGEGTGSTLDTLTAMANGTVSDATMFGGRLPTAMFTASVDHDVAHITASGSLADFDPAVVSQKATLKGTVAGQFEVDATLRDISAGVHPETVEGTIRATLEPSEIGGLAISKATIDADYRDQVATVRQLDVTGVDANATAHGTVALNDSGESNLEFKIDSPRLGELARLAGVDVSGLGNVNGVLTGNRRLLTATGTLEAGDIKYNDYAALTVRSAYVVHVPDLDFERVSVESDGHATFLTVAGQNINELTEKSSYADHRLTFDASAKQPDRSANASGSLTLHPDHQEVHLERLSIQTANQTWQVPAGDAPAIQYANGVVTTDGIRLVNGTQEISAKGSFGEAEDALDVELKSVDLATVDALLLRPPQFTGSLNAKAVVSGTTDAPHVSADFQVTNGGFREFHYQTFGGTARYEGTGLTIDTRLQQNETQWITAKGYVPAAAFRPGSAERAPGHSEPVSAADRIDVTVDSSPLGLGLIQGFTTAVTGVAGTLEAHLHVGGAADDPHPTGTLVVADGAMKVDATGVNYTNIAGRVNLEADRVHIDQFTVLDNHQAALSITGDLAVHEGEVGGVHLYVNAEDFKIIDNAMGNLRVQSAMELVGELRKPQVEGYFGVTSGKINLDEVLAFTGASSAYSTTQIEYGPAKPAAADASKPAEQQPLFDALRMNVHVTVPDDLVIIARDLQPPGAVVGLGALNVTLGGDLTAIKEPGGRVRLTGSVNTVRGNYDFQGRRFDILRDGTVRFDGLEDFNPMLDIRTQRIIQGVEAHVNVRGRLNSPEIQLSSVPPQPEADIMALIIFNQPLSTLGAGEQISVAQRAQSLAVGAVTGQISQSIGRALNLDLFEIQVAPDSHTAAQFTVGQQLGPNLYLKVQEMVGDASVTNVIVEYAITNWLRLQTNIEQGTNTQQSVFRRTQGTGADLIILFTR